MKAVKAMCSGKNEYHLLIYQSLREEIIERLNRSFTVVTSTLVGVPSVVLAGRFLEEMYSMGAALLLLAPILVVTAGFFYVSEFNGVMRAGRYLRENIEPTFTGVLGWESWLEAQKNETTRKVDQYLNLSVFSALGLYLVGSIMALWHYSSELFGMPYLLELVVAIYICLGIAMLFVAFFRIDL